MDCLGEGGRFLFLIKIFYFVIKGYIFSSLLFVLIVSKFSFGLWVIVEGFGGNLCFIVCKKLRVSLFIWVYVFGIIFFIKWKWENC